MLIKKIFLNLFFPKQCLSCQREGDYLCQDCRATLGISGFHQKYKTQCLADLYFPLPYRGQLIKGLLQQFKYEPFIKELAKPLSLLIIEHFQMLDQPPDFSDCPLIAVPLEKRRLKWRGFNQSEEIAKELAEFFKIPFLNNILMKIKKTPAQVELAGKARKENLKGVFLVKNQGLVKGERILLVDDIYTTGATMEECARVLKEAGAKEIIGIVVARD